MRTFLGFFVLLILSNPLMAREERWDSYIYAPTATYPEAVEVVRVPPHASVDKVNWRYVPAIPMHMHSVYVVETPSTSRRRAYLVYGLQAEDEAAVWAYHLGRNWIDYPKKGQRVYFPAQPVAYMPVNADGNHEPDPRILGYSADGHTIYADGR